MIDGLVNNRNSSLFKELEKNYTIKVKLVTNTDQYGCYSMNNRSIIYVPESNICAASFTHELLHIYLRSKGIFIGARLKRNIQSSKILPIIYSEGLIDHMGNCLDHIKMLPIYLEMGFDRSKFIYDYEKNKCTKQDVEIIALYWKQGMKYNAHLTDFYLGKYFGAKACPNTRFNYENSLQELRQIDELFFSINENLISRWSAMTIESQDLLEDDYKVIAGDYVEEMEVWMKSEIIE